MSGQAPGVGGKGRPPPNPNNGSGNAVDNSNGVANGSGAAGNIGAQTNSTYGSASMTPNATPGARTNAPLGQTSTQGATGSTGQDTAQKGQGKGGQPQPPAQSTYAATMQAALNGAPAPVPGQNPPAPAGTMSSQASAAMTPQTVGGETNNMPVQNPNSVQTPGTGNLDLTQLGQAGGVGAVMDAVGKGQGKGGTPGAPAGPGMLGGMTGTTGATGTTMAGTAQNNFTDGYAQTRSSPYMPPTTDWSKVDPNAQRTPNGQAQVQGDPNAMFSIQPGTAGAKLANFTFQNPTEPWQKNYNALPPQLRLQYAAANQGGQGLELLAHAMQDAGGIDKSTTDMMRNAFGGSGSNALGKMGAEGLGFKLTDPSNTMALGGSAVHMEGNTMYRVGPDGQKVVMATLPYAQTMGREANGAWGGQYAQQNLAGRAGRPNEQFQGYTGATGVTGAPTGATGSPTGATGVTGAPTGVTGVTGPPGATPTGVTGVTGVTGRTARTPEQQTIAQLQAQINAMLEQERVRQQTYNAANSGNGSG